MQTKQTRVALAALMGSTLLGGMAHASPLADLVDKVSPAVVTIFSTQNVAASEFQGAEDGQMEDFFKQFGMPDGMPGMPGAQEDTRPVEGLGSGFVLDADGYIVTNNHVVEGADEVTVKLGDDREFQAEIIGTDPQSDLALLHIDATGLDFVALGDSDSMRVGDDVMAVGNPFGLGGTVTSGIISAKGRDINAGPYVDYLQTDASINKGNSGGPLFNMDGEVIGVNSAIFSPTGGSVGVGFAVPSNIVTDVVAQLKADGSVDRGWLGVSIQEVTPAIAAALGMEDAKGALVADVVPDSPAMGILKSGDVILELGDDEVGSSRDLPRLVAAVTPDTVNVVKVLRDGAEMDLDVTIGQLQTEKMASLTGKAEKHGDASAELGATLSNLTPEIREGLNLGEDVKGTVITSLQSDGPAAEAGLEVGDVIVRAGTTDIESAAQLDKVLTGLDSNKTLLLVNRDGNPFFVGISL